MRFLLRHFGPIALIVLLVVALVLSLSGGIYFLYLLFGGQP